MAWILDTNLEKPFYQIGMLSGDGLAADDRSARAEVARVYQKGGRKLLPEEQPARLDLTDTSDLAKVPTLFGSMDGVLVASPACHTALMTLAPASLQTWPLLLSHNNQPLDADCWFAVNIHRRAESIDLDHSAVKQSRGFDGIVRPALRLRKKKVGLLPGADQSMHIWRDETFPHVILISGEMKELLDSLGSLAALTCFETSEGTGAT